MRKRRRLIPILLSICLVFGSFGFSFALESTEPSASDATVETPTQTEQTTGAATEQSTDKQEGIKTKDIKPRAIVGATMEIDNPYIEFNSRQEHTIVVTVPKTVVDDDAAQEYADNADWYLTRNKDDSPFRKDPTIRSYFKNIYTGDKLENWRKWGTSGSSNNPLFLNKTVTGVKKGGEIEITLKFKNDFFLGNNWSNTAVANRNLQGSVVGDYKLSVKEKDGTVIVSDTMNFVPYKSYRTYMELRDELEKLKPKAAAKGYELKIEDIGISEGGFPQYTVVFGKSGKANHWLELTDQAETDPAGLQKKIDRIDYAIPMFMNNVHSDECPGSDTMVDTLKLLIENDKINISQISSWKTSDPGGYITPPIRDWATTLGRDTAGQGSSNVESRYNFTDDVVKVNQLLEDVFFVMCPNENPDGRISNGRRNSNGFDLNRDGTFQTQSETQTLEPYIAKWNPIVMNEYHGYVSNFLIEPCSPPHEQNLEYDVTIENFYKMAEVYGNTALGSIRDTYKYGSSDQSHMSKYIIPLRDYFNGTNWTNDWDDLSTNYGPSYAMINSGTMGYTIEIPYNDQMSTDALTYGTLGMANYMSEHKNELFKNQLEVFRRGVENIDVTTEEENSLEQYYYDANDKLIDHDAWRVKFDGPGETGKFFPEYYVIPKDATNQRDAADVNDLEKFLDRNDVKMKTLNKDTVIDGKTYKAGTLIVDMHQAKRNYANAVLWQGIDAGKTFSALYSECVVNFPELRGFDCIAVAKENAIPAGNLRDLTNPGQGRSTLEGKASGNAVILKNNGTAAVSAVNDLLAQGIAVGIIEDGPNKGQFLIEKAAWTSINSNYVLSGIGVDRADGTVKKVKQPAVYVTGRDAPYTGTSTNTHTYWNEWFSDGYGSALHPNTMNSGTYEGTNFDREAYQDQMKFKIVESPKDASIIVGTMALNRGTHGSAALADVKDGKPYIATGAATFSVLNSDILPNNFFTYGSTSSSESMHKVKYVDDSIITAPQRASGDDVIYNYGGGRIETLNYNATVLYKSGSIEDDFHIAGCFPRASLSDLSNKVEAFTYKGAGKSTDKVDVTVFANSATRKAHQQDDYLFVTNTIYSKHMGDTWAQYSGKATDLSKASISKIANQVYSGQARTPAVKVTLAGKTLKKNVDYTVSYAKNKSIGKATVKVTGKGSYTGQKTSTFNIIPKTTSISSIKVSKGKMTVKWKKVSGATKYQIKYKVTTSKKWVVKSVSAKSASLAVKKLTKGKKYQVQVRSYKTVNKLNFYSNWSKTKTSKTIK